MKELNLNNTIAATAMLTKTNTMKNKMNLFAKVVVLVVMMGMLLSEGVWNEVYGANPTYANNQWYSFYDGGEHSTAAIDDILGKLLEGDVYPPCDSKISFNVKVDKFIWNGSGRVRIKQSTNGNDYQKEDDTQDFNSKTHSSYQSYTSSNIISSDIIKVRLSRIGGANDFYIKNTGILLAKHVRFESGSAGTASKSMFFNNIVVGETSSITNIDLRSFYTTGKLMVKIEDNGTENKCNDGNSLAQVFKLYKNGNTPKEYGELESGSNICGFKGGGANGSVNTTNYLSVQFCPDRAKTYRAKITIYDSANGNVCAVLSVEGTGTVKSGNELTWTTTGSFYAFQTITAGNQAKANSVKGSIGEIDYSNIENLESLGNKQYKIQSAGNFTIRATQIADCIWDGATSDITLTASKVTPVISSFATLDKGYVGTQYDLSGKVNWAATSGHPARSAWVNDDGVVINYTSSNTDIATIATNSATFTPNGKAGVTNITASINEANNHNASTNSEQQPLQIDFNQNAIIYTFTQNTKVGESTTEEIRLADYFVPNGNYTVSVNGTGFAIDGNNSVTQSVNKFSVKFTAPTFDASLITKDYTATITITDADSREYSFKIQAKAEKKDVSLTFDDLGTIYVFTTLNNITCTTAGMTSVTYSPSLPYTFNSTATTTFTATSAMTNTYKSGTAQIQVTPQKVTPELSWEGTELGGLNKGGDKVYLTGYSWSLQEVPNPSVSPLPGISAVFSSDNTNIATTGQDENGWYVLMKGTGTCNITMGVDIDANNAGNYNSATPVSHPVTVTGKSDQTISWNSSDLDGKFTGESVTMSATASSGLTNFDYTFSDNSIAKYENGQIKFLKGGRVTITITQPGDAAWNEVSDSKTVIVGLDFGTSTTVGQYSEGQEVVLSSFGLTGTNVSLYTSDKNYRLIHHHVTEGVDLKPIDVGVGRIYTSATSSLSWPVANNIEVKLFPLNTNSANQTLTVTDGATTYQVPLKGQGQAATLSFDMIDIPNSSGNMNLNFATQYSREGDLYVSVQNDNKIFRIYRGGNIGGRGEEEQFNDSLNLEYTKTYCAVRFYPVSSSLVESAQISDVIRVRNEVNESDGYSHNVTYEVAVSGTYRNQVKTIKKSDNSNPQIGVFEYITINCQNKRNNLTVSSSNSTEFLIDGSTAGTVATTSNQFRIYFMPKSTKQHTQVPIYIKETLQESPLLVQQVCTLFVDAIAEQRTLSDFETDLAVGECGSDAHTFTVWGLPNYQNYRLVSSNPSVFKINSSTDPVSLTGDNTTNYRVTFCPELVQQYNETIYLVDQDNNNNIYPVTYLAANCSTKGTPTVTFNMSDQQTTVFSTITGIAATSNSGGTITFDVATEYDDNGETKKTGVISNKTEAATSTCDLKIVSRDYKSPGTEGVTKLVATVAETDHYNSATCTLTVTATKVTPVLNNWTQGDIADKKVGDSFTVTDATWTNSTGEPDAEEWGENEVAIVYATNNDVVSAIGNTIYADKAGVATITPTIEEGINHNGASSSQSKTVKVDFADAALNCGTAYAGETEARKDITDMIVPVGTLTYSTTDNDFKVEISDNTIVVVYAPTTYKASSDATITFTDADGKKYHLNVTAGCVKHEPTVTWVDVKTLPILDPSDAPLTKDELVSVCTYCDGLEFSSTNTNVALVLDGEYNIADRGTLLFPLNNGQTTITIFISETESRWGGEFSETFTVAGVQATQISWQQDLQNLTTENSPVTLDAIAVTLTGNPTGQTITYDIVDNPGNIISITDGVMTFTGTGTARIKATAAANSLYYQSEMEKDVRIVDPAAETRCVEPFDNVTAESGATYEFKKEGHEDYYEVEKIEYHCYVKGMAASGNPLSPTPGENRTITAKLYNGDSQVGSDFIYTGNGGQDLLFRPATEIDKDEIITPTQTVTKIEFSGPHLGKYRNSGIGALTGSWTNQFTAIKVTPKSYLRPVGNKSYTFGSSDAPILAGDTSTTGEITVEYSFLNSPVTISFVNNNNDDEYPGKSNFSYKVTQPDVQCDYGEMKLTVSFHPSGTETYHKCRLKLTGLKGTEELTEYLTIEGYANRKPQTIIWNQDLDNWNSMSGTVFFENAATSAGLSVTQFDLQVGTDADAVELTDGNKLTIKKSGHVKVKASHPGNDIYLPADSIRDFDIARAESNLHWDNDNKYTDGWIYVFDTKQITALPENDANTGAIKYEVTRGDASFSGNDITINKCESITVMATIAETDIFAADTITKTFMPAKVTPVVAWSGSDFQTDLSHNTFTLTDEATVTETEGQPDVSKWTDGKTVTYSSSTGTVATLQSGKVFNLNKVGYATITAKVEAGDNNETSNDEVRHLKVDFNPNDERDFGEVGIFKKDTIYLDLTEIVNEGTLSASSYNTDFTLGTVADNKLPIIFSPQSHDASDPVKTAIITIHDAGNGQDYHLHVKGTSILTEATLKYNPANHNGWQFIVILPNETTQVAYGGTAYDIDWDIFPDPSLYNQELAKIELSLKNPTDDTYVDIVDNLHFVVKQANAYNDDDVEVILLATYPGIPGRIDSASIEIPITIKKNQYTLTWGVSSVDITVAEHSRNLTAPTLNLEGGDSTISYSFSEAGFATYNGTTLTLTGPPYKSVILKASIASDKYAKSTSATLPINVSKSDQYVVWNGDEISAGFNTQKSTTEGIILQGGAFRNNQPTGSNVKYSIVSQTNACGKTDLVSLVEDDNVTPRKTTLYYTGNGSGTVSIQAIGEENDQYHRTNPDDSTASPTITFTIFKATRTVAWGNDTSSLTIASPDVTLDAYTINEKNMRIDDADAGTVTYSIENASSITGQSFACAELSSDNKTLIINGEGTATLKAHFYGSCMYEDASATWNITIADETLTIRVDTIDDGVITSTTSMHDMWQYITVLNYEGVDIDTIISQPQNIEGILYIQDSRYMTLMKEAGTTVQVPCTVTVTSRYLADGSNPTATGNITFSISKGTLIFNVAGKWTEAKKWSRKDIVETYGTENYNVLIADSCFIGKDSAYVDTEEDFLQHTVDAACHDLTIDGTNAKLVIGEASTLNVKGNLMNNDSSKLVLTANKWGQASVVFGNDNEHQNPKATVEMFVPQGNGSNTDPIWQYRGIIVDSFAIGNGPWECMAIYYWDEETNDNLDQGCWHSVTNGGNPAAINLSPWTGYAFANICRGQDTAATWLTYTGTLIREDQNIGLSYHKKEYEENKPFANVGINLITNSYSVPLRISELGYPKSNCDSAVVLYNAGTYSQYQTAGGEAGNTRGNPGQYSTVPKHTGASATDIITIPSGQSFFVNAKATGATLTLSYSAAITISPSGRMFMPKADDEPEFNMLKINVTANGSKAADQVALLECETCSRQYDNGYDGKKMLGKAGLPQLYAYNKFGITAVNADSTFNKQFIGFNAGSDDETYTISFETDRLFGYHSLYLTDRKLNETVDILAGETYSFKGYTVGENMRFQINGVTEKEWEENGQGENDDTENVCDLRVVGNSLYIEGFTANEYPAANIEIFDMTGNPIWSTPLTSSRIYDLPTSLPQGIYVVRLGDCHTKYSNR